MTYAEYADHPPAMGQVPTTGRGSMPFTLLDGEPLVSLATLALESAGIEPVDFNVELAAARSAGRALVVHDPLCPLTPAGFLRETLQAALDLDLVVVGVQPVTDTVKRVSDGVVGETVDREALWSLASPVVLPPSVVAGLDRWPDCDDLPGLVARLRECHEVRYLEAPPLARRVEDESALRLLEALAAGAVAAVEGAEPA